ncbi:MAG: tetratricopeptide repeat protein [Salinisphaera sp.]|nr:tetratricopeptide repeat protein [Salinisphaera sp.]
MQQKFQAMLDAGHDGALLRFSLGELCFKAGDLDAAVTHLAEAVRQDSQYSAAWKLYGRALLDQGQFQDALETLERGIEVANARGDNQAAREMQVFRKRAVKAQR